jgi:hypothetical protein
MLSLTMKSTIAIAILAPSATHVSTSPVGFAGVSEAEMRRVVHRTKRIVFCSAEAFDADGNVLAAARCTQILRAS